MSCTESTRPISAIHYPGSHMGQCAAACIKSNQGDGYGVPGGETETPSSLKEYSATEIQMDSYSKAHPYNVVLSIC